MKIKIVSQGSSGKELLPRT